MRALMLGAIVLAMAIVSVSAVTPAQTPYVWDLPAGWPAPRVPADNPMSDAKVRLGRELFYDTRLSGNGTQSCASCHAQTLAFTDGRGQAVGSTGQRHPRGSMSLVNIAYADTLTWANPDMHALEAQAAGPMFGTTPVELGLTEHGPWLQALAADRRLAPMFADAFGMASSAITVDHVTKAIASFERSIISARSPWDRYRQTHDNSAISEAARRGEVLFHSQPFTCFRCHGDFLFSNTADFSGRTTTAPLVRRPEDPAGYRKAPTLRNIALTAPYMHDGSVPTLDGLVSHGFPKDPAQRADLIAFLEALTDSAVLTDPRFGAPNREDARAARQRRSAIR